MAISSYRYRIRLFGLLVLGTVPAFSGCGDRKSETAKGKENEQVSSSQASKGKGPGESPSKYGDSSEQAKGQDKSGVAGAGESFDDRIAKAETLLTEKQVEEAWKLAKALMIERPQDPQSIFLAARVLAAKNDLKGAIQTISKIDFSDPKAGPPAMGQLAEWLAVSGDLHGAESRLKTLLKNFPNATPAIRLLIEVYSAEGRRWDSAKLLDRLVRMGNFKIEELMKSIDFREPFDNESIRKAAMSFAPNDPYSALGDLRIMANRNRWINVVDSLEKLVQAKPELLEPWIWYGESLLETGRLDAMSAWISKRPEGYASHPEYWYVMGSWLTQQKKPREAARCYVESLKLDRRHVASTLALAESLVELGLNELATDVRNAAGKLVRINDMAQQIQRGYGGREEYIAIANLYRELDDVVGAFGWDAILLVNEKKPMTDELIATQKKLKSGATTELTFLKNLPVSEWPMPDDSTFVSIERPKLNSSELGGDIPVRMNDVAKERGLLASYNNGAEPNRGWFTLEGIGGGLTVIDYDRDGWPDLYCSDAGDFVTKQSPHYLPKTLHHSVASTRFDDVTASARVGDLGYGQGVGTADIDQDGFSDLLVSNIAEVAWYRNQGDGTFERMALPQAPAPLYWNTGIQAADVNNDSLPDIVQCVYVDGEEAFSKWCQNTASLRGNCHPKRFRPGKSRILYSQGDGTFVVAEQSLLDSLVDGYPFGPLITNIDQREGNDIFFANDVSPNHLLLSKRDRGGARTLVECAAAAGVAVDALGRAQACMGIACGDQNRDGTLDIIVTNYRNEVSTLYLQTSPGVFIDGTRQSNLGVHTLDWLSFGAQLIDLDSDGWLDFITLNGHIDDLTSENVPWKMPPQVLHSDKGKFNWLRKPSPGAYFDVDNVGRSLQAIDFDRDGRMDFAATHLDRPVAMLHNETERKSNHFVQFVVVGTESERDAIGAMIHVFAGDDHWIQPVSVGDGFYGTNERVMQVGIGKHDRIERVEIVWPTGNTETYRELGVDARYCVTEKIGISKEALEK